jgi:hypothetical protein
MTKASRDEAERLAAKLAPERIRLTLAFAGLFQMTHEMIKSAVLDGVAGFYGHVDVPDVWMWGRDGYDEEVMSRAPGKPFVASIAWLVERGAITQEQSDRVAVIYAHRHDLTHELPKYIAFPEHEPDYTLFIDALNILQELCRFWAQIEIDIGTFEEHGEVTADEVTPLNLVVLGMCVRSCFEAELSDDEDAPRATLEGHE